MSQDDTFGITWGLVVVGSSVFTGGLVVVAPPAAVFPPFLLGFLTYVHERRGRIWWDIFVVAIAGALVLAKGFANVGVGPAPVADLLLAGLLLRSRAVGSAPFAWGALFVAWAVVRLFLDYPQYGILAIRDFTLPLEMTWAVVGYWMMARYGRDGWVRILRWLFFLVALHAALSVWDGLTKISPIVGIDRETPLLGAYYDGAIALAVLFFALVRPFRRFSYVLAGISLALVLVEQVRSLYVLVPAVFIVLWVLAEESRRRLFAAFGVGLVGIALVVGFAPQGRFGATSLDFFVSHFATLRGAEGPGAGSIESRQQWYRTTLDTVEADSFGWVIGVGLGPDLIGGFAVEGGLVRKPHNDYLEVFARYGIVGLVPFAMALLVALYRILTAARRSRDPLLWFFFAAVLVFLGQAAVQPLLSFPYGTIPVFAFLGAGLALRDVGQLHSSWHERG